MEQTANRIGRSIAVLLALTVFPALSARAEESPLDRFETVARLGETALPLHGQGTRKATLFAVEVYHAAFYAPSSMKGLVDILAAPRPLRLDIRYVRDFDLEDTNEAWLYQFRESSGSRPEEIAEDLRRLVSFQKAIRKGDLHRFDFESGRTVFYINEERRGEIAGERFQNALLTVFFGPHPPTKELQRGLLAGPGPGAIAAARELAASKKGKP